MCLKRLVQTDVRLTAFPFITSMGTWILQTIALETETRQLLKQETVTGVVFTWTICVGVWTVHLCLGICVSWMGGDWPRELSCVPGLWRSVNATSQRSASLCLICHSPLTDKCNFFGDKAASIVTHNL